jgi:aryl-alcohol dehydrogenase-like predicted oxidoreductase
MADGGVAVGLSTSGPHQAEVIRRAMAVERGGQRLFRTVQSTWNLLEPSAGEALAEAHDAGLGVIVKEAVANGWLTERGVPRLPAALAGALAAADPGAGSPDQVALAAAMAQPFADVVLSGAATVDQLRSNVGALDRVASVDLDAVASLAVDPERYWQMRSELPWN